MFANTATHTGDVNNDLSSAPTVPLIALTDGGIQLRILFSNTGFEQCQICVGCQLHPPYRTVFARTTLAERARLDHLSRLSCPESACRDVSCDKEATELNDVEG